MIQQTRQPQTDSFQELEQAVFETPELRRDLTDLFANGFDFGKFVHIRNNYTIFSGYLYNLIDKQLASDIHGVQGKAKHDRSLIQTNIDYYNSLDSKIRAIEDKNKASPDLIPLRKERARRPKVMEKLQKSMKKIDDEEREALARIQAKVTAGDEDPELYEKIYDELKRNVWADLNNYNLREDAAETMRRNRLANSIRTWRRRILYAAGGVAGCFIIAAGFLFGIPAISSDEPEEKGNLVEEIESVDAKYIGSDDPPHSNELAADFLDLRGQALEITEQSIKPEYEIAAEYKPGDIIWGKIGSKMIVYQGIIYQDGRPFLQFRNDQIADQATHNHELNRENLDNGFDCVPDCRPFLGKYLFDVDIKSLRIRLLREIIPNAQNPFQHYGLRYSQHVNIPITELATLRPEWGIPNKYLISEDPHDPGKKFVQIIWLRRTTMQIDTKGQGYLSDAVLSTPINLTNIFLDQKPDCVIEGNLPGERFYVDVDSSGDIRFLKKVR